MKRLLPALLAALLFSTSLHSQALIPYRDGTRWGYCNPEGKIILPCIYNNAFPFTPAGAVVVVNNKYGLIDTKGKWLIPASFDSLGQFNNSIAIFKKEGKLGLTDKTGKITLPADYQKIELLKSGFYQLCLSEILNGFADKKGVLILPAEYREVNDFRHGRAVVQKKWSNDPWNIIDEKGNIVFSMKSGEGFYDNNAKFFSNGVLHYRTFSPNAGGGLYDSSGKMLIYIPNACCYNEEERILRGMYMKGLFPATRSGEIKDTLPDGKIITLKYPVGYSDGTGQFVIKPKFNEAGEFRNGTALVLQDGKAWLINEKGESVMTEKYNKGFYVSNTRVVFRNNYNNYYLYETSGKLLATLEGLKLATATYWTEGISEYKDGVAMVIFKDETRGYIDSMGKFLTGMRFNSGPPFTNGLAYVTLDEETSYLNKKGQLFYRRTVIPVGRQQWDYQDLNTRVFANGDSIYKAVSITDFSQKGLEKKPAFYPVSYIPNTQSKTRLLYNWYAVTDPRGLAPAGWMIPSVEEFEQMKKAVCADSIAPDILYAMGFDNGGQLLKETGLETRYEGRWWTRNPEQSSFDFAKGVALLVSKDNQRSDLQTGVYLRMNGLAVRCIRKPEPVKPGIKLPPLPKLNCDSLLAITQNRIKVPAPRKVEPLKLSSDFAWKMDGKYKTSRSKLTLRMKPDFISYSSSSTLQIDRESEGMIYIMQEGTFSIKGQDVRFHMYFYMKTGAPYHSSSGDPLKTWLPLSDAGRRGRDEATTGNYARGEHFSGTYCIETGEIRITGTIIIMNGNQEITRGLYELDGKK